MYVLVCRLSHFRLCGSDFVITPVDDISNGITWDMFCFHIAHISFASYWYLFCLSVIVLARLCIFRTAMSIKKVFFVFLLMNVISGRLKGIVLSVSMLLLQYCLKLSFSIIIIIIILLSPNLSEFYDYRIWTETDDIFWFKILLLNWILKGAC
jgi:hypothetical protein